MIGLAVGLGIALSGCRKTEPESGAPSKAPPPGEVKPAEKAKAPEQPPSEPKRVEAPKTAPAKPEPAPKPAVEAPKPSEAPKPPPSTEKPAVPPAPAVPAPEPAPVPAPAGAIILFDGKDVSGWVGEGGKPCPWKVENGALVCVPGSGNIMTKEKYGDAQLHVEFKVPLMPDKKGQARGNSGVYVQGRYEIQVLDSYGLAEVKADDCGALYGIIAPSKNACKPPEQWQTYDIKLQAPKFDAEGKMTKKGRLTVVQNGTTIIDNAEFDRPTGGGVDDDMSKPGPLMLQDHGNLVKYRNIWLVPLKAE